MVRYLKFPVTADEQNASVPLVSAATNRIQKVTETLKEIPLETLSSLDKKNLKTKSSPAPQNKKEALSPLIFPKSKSENLVQKVHALETKLQDYEELVRKKQTADKLALQLKKEEEDELPSKKISALLKTAEVATKQFHAVSLKKHLTWVNALILIVSVAAMLISTYVFLLMTKSNYELTAVYRLLPNKKKQPDDQLINRLAAYLNSDALLTQMIEAQEKLSPNESKRRQQLAAWLNEYRRNIKIQPDTAKNVIKVNVHGENPEKVVLTARKLTEAYTDIINTQKSLDDYLQYLRKAIDKSMAFKNRDKVILLTEGQEAVMKDFSERQSVALKAQLAGLEEEEKTIQNSLSADEESKYLSGMDHPQTVDDYILLGFKNRLIDLEIASLIADKTGEDVVLINGFSTELLQVRNRIENLIKAHIGQELKADEIQQLALFLRKMTIEIKKEGLIMILGGQFGVQKNFTITQKEYLVNQKNIHQLLDNYAFYINSKEVLGQVLENRASGQSLITTRSPWWITFQWRGIYGYSLCLGLFLGMMMIIIRNAYQKSIVS